MRGISLSHVLEPMPNTENPNLVEDYTSRVNKFVDLCGSAGKAVCDNQKKEFSCRFLSLLTDRDKIASLLSARNLAPTEIEAVAEADQQLKKHARLIVQCVGVNSFGRWSDSGLIPNGEVQPTSWWWKLNEQVPDRSFSRLARPVANIALWLFIALALSYIVEIARRFVGRGPDVASVVMQGFLALLVGGTIVQFARQLVEGTKGNSGSTLFNTKSLLVLAGVLLVFWTVLYKAQPRIAAYYSDRGVTQRKENDYAHAIQNLLRATDLNPADAIAHYNLAVAYQQTKDYDTAEVEYRAAIKWDPAQYLAYSELARLVILRRSDYAEALRLSEAGLKTWKTQTSDKSLDEFAIRSQYSLLVMRGWAYLGLQLYRQAENSLNTAIAEAQNVQQPVTSQFHITGAEAVCLKGKLLDIETKALRDQKKSKEAEDTTKKALCAFLTCREVTSGGAELEPDLFGLMQERLSTSTFPNCE